MALGLHMLRTCLILFVVSVVFFGCNKSNFRWLTYDETYCSDKWAYTLNNEKQKDNIVAYMDKQGVKVFEIEIFNDRTPDSCKDCNCKSGRRIKCKIKKRDESLIKKEGFY